MKILITGALGYIGSETLLRFAQRPDITVFALDNDPDALRDRGAFFQRYSNIHVIAADITKPMQIPQVDLIVHLAAIVGYNTCDINPELTYCTNTLGTKQIAELNTPTIFFSTGSVYGEIGEVCNELVKPNPKTVYAVTKYQAEEYIKKVPYVIFRPATAFGLGLKTRHDLLVHDLTRQAIKNKQISLYQSCARRSFYSVQKLAELIEFATDNFAMFKDNTYNVGCYSGNVTKQNIIDYLRQYVDFECVVTPGKDADTRDYNVCYDRLAAVWPNLNEKFEDYIPKLVDYYKQW